MKVTDSVMVRPSESIRAYIVRRTVALTVFAVGEGFSSVFGNADGKTVSATKDRRHLQAATFMSRTHWAERCLTWIFPRCRLTTSHY